MTQSEIGQKQKLRVVLDYINHILNVPPVWSQQKWSVDSKFNCTVVYALNLTLRLAILLKKKTIFVNFFEKNVKFLAIF